MADPKDPEPFEGPTPSGNQPQPSTPQPVDPLSLARSVADSYRNGPARKARPAPNTSTHRSIPQRSKRRSREDPVPLSELLNELVNAQGWSGRLATQRIFSDWAGIVGPEIAEHSSVTELSDAVVRVRTDSTAWATQLKFLAPRIVAKLNTELGEGTVMRIEVSGPQAPSWTKGSRSVRGARGPRDTYG